MSLKFQQLRKKYEATDIEVPKYMIKEAKTVYHNTIDLESNYLDFAHWIHHRYYAFLMAKRIKNREVIPEFSESVNDEEDKRFSKLRNLLAHEKFKDKHLSNTAQLFLFNK